MRIRVPLALLALARAGLGQNTIPLRQVSSPIAAVAESLSLSGPIRVLSDGRVIVNDFTRRHVLLFDSSLGHRIVLLDTSAASARKYPVSGGTLIPWRGDSTLLYDHAAVALIVLDPAGRIVRTMAPPFPPDAGYLSVGVAAVDSMNRAVYRASTSPTARPIIGLGDAMGYMVVPADSAPIVRAAPGAPAPDTVAWVRAAPPRRTEPFTTADGLSGTRPVLDPFVLVDEWTITSDGTIAVVRGQDYHVDWITPDGHRTASGKVPFVWHRLSDGDKAHIVDSLKAYAEAHPNSYTHLVNGHQVRGTLVSGVVPAESLADYRPPFARGAVLADDANDIWVLASPETPVTSTPGQVYDVINRQGVLFERVQIPGGTTIAGFGAGVLYLSTRVGRTTSLVRVRIR